MRDLQRPWFVGLVSAPELIDLGRGHPDPTLLPAELLRSAAAAPISVGALSYGRESGRRSFLATLARFIESTTGAAASPDSLLVTAGASHESTTGAAASPDNLLVTAGASHGLDLIAARLARPGDTVVVETPSYFHALGLLRQRGLHVESVPVDNEGIRIDALEALLERVRPAFVYTIPVFHNPAGVTASPARRRALLALAEAHDFRVVADEVYQLLSFGPPPPPPLRQFGADRVLSLGSFSKILAPGLRLGWIEAEPDLLRHLTEDGVLKSGGGVSPWVQAVIRPLLEQGTLRDLIHELREAYRARAQALDAGLRAALGPHAKMRKPDGGYFSWVELPEAIEAQALLPLARQHGVSFLPGNSCSATKNLPNHLRAGFSLYPPDILQLATERLGRALAEMS